jgi:hypothetical protein
MGQLESLRELSIAQPTQRRKRKKKMLILPWLFHLIGIPMNFEILILRLK